MPQPHTDAQPKPHRIGVRLTEDLYHLVADLADSRDETISEVIREAIEEKVAFVRRLRSKCGDGASGESHATVT